MTTHAYNELYLSDAQISLANIFDYAINDCHQDPNFFAKLFVIFDIAKEFENGNPSIISGKAGVEIAQEILKKANPNFNLPKQSFSIDRSPEYWVGYYLAYYQWYSSKRFIDIFAKITLTEIISMYKVFHEMDLTNFVEEIDKRINSIVLTTKLKSIRESRGLSQSELSLQSGVKLRSIQLYEQRVNDINKAQAESLFKLSKVLGCNIEDLLE